MGTGENIDMGEDHWIPNNPIRKVMTPRGHTILRKVAGLINPRTGQWDEVLIRDIFLPIDANRILMIPLSSNQVDDFIDWNATKSFSFSL